MILKKQQFKKVKLKILNRCITLTKRLYRNNDFKKLIDKSDVISFDIFDTVIVRKVLDPADIFTIVENLYIKKYGELSFKFKKVRTKAEPEATKIATKISGVQSLNLDEIYHHIQTTQNLDNEITERLKTLEIEIEQKFCIRNEYMYKFYQYCIDNGKKVIFTSDMYLPESVITKILHDNGYTTFNKLYLSSTIRKSKSKGTLFNHILNELACPPSSILHVGDYFYADIINAMKKGIKTYYYEKPSEYAFQRPEFKILKELYNKNLSIDESIYFATVINKVFTRRGNNNVNLWYDFGYIYCGIIYLGFIRWLTNKLVEQQVEKAFFLARDGYMMHKVYNLMNQGQAVPPSQYMYASRRAINIPTICDNIDESSLKLLCNIFPNLSVRHYLDRVDINSDQHIAKIKAAGFIDKNDKIVSPSDQKKLATLFQLLTKEVCEVSANERENLTSYLQQIDFLRAGKIAIVDIGWQGTMQNSIDKLSRILNKKLDVEGYYLGTFDTAKRYVSKGLPMSGYICNFSQPQKNYDVVISCVHLFEFIFSAPHGSVINFKSDKEGITPVCEEHISSHRTTEIINEFQEGTLDFIKDFMKTESDCWKMEISPETSINPISRLLTTPTYEESVQFGNLTHSEYVGNYNYERHLAKTSGSWSAFTSPFKFKKHYYSSLWKVGFRRRYIGNILPEKVFSYIKKVKKRRAYG
ncbi:HAD family hydrolase [Psychromonas sp. GE-S-Ul-11]|uniref:HAD family hydrolase n=1 Tax=Psychromonas sp. GE-S-Ul-11 TaxID=3241170 RepID=UPI00390C430F